MKQGDIIPVTIPLEVAWLPENTSGKATLKYQDCTCDVVDDKGNDVGAVSAGVGCTVDIRINKPDGQRGYTYRLRPDAIWRAVVRMHNAATGDNIPTFDDEVADVKLLNISGSE